MEQLRVRKICTEASGNTYYVLFETGNLKTPICIMDEFEFKELLNEMHLAETNQNILRHRED
jgi:hypothetical protein